MMAVRAMMCSVVREVVRSPRAHHVDFWSIMLVTGVAGFLINIAIFLVVRYTTPLTNTMAGTAKACVQTVLAVLWFGNPISALKYAHSVASLVSRRLTLFVFQRDWHLHVPVGYWQLLGGAVPRQAAQGGIRNRATHTLTC